MVHKYTYNIPDWHTSKKNVLWMSVRVPAYLPEFLWRKICVGINYWAKSPTTPHLGDFGSAINEIMSIDNYIEKQWKTSQLKYEERIYEIIHKAQKSLNTTHQRTLTARAFLIYIKCWKFTPSLTYFTMGQPIYTQPSRAEMHRCIANVAYARMYLRCHDQADKYQFWKKWQNVPCTLPYFPKG